PLDTGIAEGFALAVTAAGLAVLLPALGILGAGLTSVIAYAAATVWLGHRAARALELPVPKILLPDRDDLRDGIWAARTAILRMRRRRAHRIAFGSVHGGDYAAPAVAVLAAGLVGIAIARNFELIAAALVIVASAFAL